MAYVATICILVDAETEAECMDAVAEIMRSTLHGSHEGGHKEFRDWMWAEGEDELIKVGQIPADFSPDNEWPWEVQP